MHVDVKYFGDDLFCTLRDEDTSSSDQIGEAMIKLSSLIVSNKGINEWFEL